MSAKRVIGGLIRTGSENRMKDGRLAKVCQRCGGFFAPNSDRHTLCFDCRTDKFYRKRTGL